MAEFLRERTSGRHRGPGDTNQGKGEGCASYLGPSIRGGGEYSLDAGRVYADALQAEEEEEPISIPQHILETHPSLAHLLDDFEIASVFAHASLIRPPVLGKVILHQIPDESHASADGPQEAKQVLAELSGDAGRPVIIRQDTHWACGNGKTYVVLLATPFTQGLISPPTTEVIISTPSLAWQQNGSTPSVVIDRMAITSSLQHKPFLPSLLARSTATRSTRQQRAMLNFSADGFLSASLVVDPARERREAGRKRRDGLKGLDELEGLEEEEEEDDDYDGFWDDELDDGSDEDEVLGGRHSASVGSLSESSGSITPRPGSYLSVDDLPERTHQDIEEPDSSLTNGVPHVQLNGHHDRANQNQTEEDTFRGFAFEPFPLRRRPISASTRFFHASAGKGKAREEVDDVGGAWPDDEAVAWLSLKGLARAGVFVGDWVGVFSALTRTKYERLCCFDRSC